MHLTYSALKQTAPKTGRPRLPANALTAARQLAYLAVCDKYAPEIAAIQKYIPGWKPTFNY